MIPNCFTAGGNWGAWTAYSCCTTTCGRGLQIRSRECNNPAPGAGGRPCQGDFQTVQFCNEQNLCPRGNEGEVAYLFFFCFFLGGGSQPLFMSVWSMFLFRYWVQKSIECCEAKCV
jgi:hypothetical protein